MAKYTSVAEAIERHQAYPALDQDLADHDFQRRRVASCVRFIRPGDLVLDVGCNSGVFADYCPRGAELYGVDCNPELVEKARTRMREAWVAPAEKLPFPDDNFDVVNVSGLLEQVFDPVAVLKEAARVSKRSLIGNTVHESGTWGKHRTESHLWQSRSYSEAEIRELLEAVGTIDYLGTVDVNTPPEPQVWAFHVLIR